ncbi:MAG TPA: hypothetical protein VGH28_00855 [Polyangiaceae bacterium]|jgi:uncharacterized membrane-anchored protein YhcB (DUF1043 family)
MAQHVFYPSPEMPDQIESYVEGLKTHHATFGDVVGNAPGDLKKVAAMAKTLAPLAKEIQDKQIELAALLTKYHASAAPAWTEFSERIGYARNFAEKHGNAALQKYLLAFRHNEGHHAAAKAAGVTPPPAAPPAT